MIIYKSTNIKNGKCYIGQTIKDLEFRKKQHKKQKYITDFNKSLKKYGWENFQWEILCECDTKEELDEMEFHYIKQYNSFEDGYNMSLGGEGGNCGNQFTKLNKEQRSKKHFLNLMSIEEKEKYLNEKYRGENHYTKRLMDEGERKEWLEKYKIGKNNPMYGKTPKFTKEWLEKLSKSRKGRIITDKTKKKISIGKMGAKNGMAKTFKIIKEDGEVEIIKGLNEYCRNNNITVWKLKRKYIVKAIEGKGE